MGNQRFLDSRPKKLYKRFLPVEIIASFHNWLIYDVLMMISTSADFFQYHRQKEDFYMGKKPLNEARGLWIRDQPLKIEINLSLSKSSTFKGFWDYRPQTLIIQ